MYGESTYILASTRPLQVACPADPSYDRSGMFLSSPSAMAAFLLTVSLCAEASAGGVCLLAAMSPNAVVVGGLLSASPPRDFLLIYSTMPSFSRWLFYISFFCDAILSYTAGEVSA